MSCIPFCYHCGRPIDCTDAGMCLLCREKLIEANRNPSNYTGLNVPEKGTNVPKK